MEECSREGEEEQVMSEVHLGCPPRCTVPHVSHFTFALPLPQNDKDTECNNQPIPECPREVAVDKDGDLVLTRRNSKQRCLSSGFNIQHSITSSLHDVGLQVWKAALLLTDFIIHKSCMSSDLNEVVGVELGAGTGLVGIALARVARTVFITDKGSAILDNCETNIHLNSSLLKPNAVTILVRDLKWEDSWPPSTSSDFSVSDRSKYSWASSEIEEAEKATLLLAADVIYSNDLTGSFFNTMENLMSRGSAKVLYLALEKRYNFSLDDLDVVANGYSHFRSFLKDEVADSGQVLHDSSRPFFLGKQIDITGIPKYIEEYERGKDLELWEIIYSFNRPK